MYSQRPCGAGLGSVGVSVLGMVQVLGALCEQARGKSWAWQKWWSQTALIVSGLQGPLCAARWQGWAWQRLWTRILLSAGVLGRQLPEQRWVMAAAQERQPGGVSSQCLLMPGTLAM